MFVTSTSSKVSGRQNLNERYANPGDSGLQGNLGAEAQEEHRMNSDQPTPGMPRRDSSGERRGSRRQHRPGGTGPLARFCRPSGPQGEGDQPVAVVSPHVPLGPDEYHRDDPAAYDINWWRQHWKRTRVQGVILNAGGIVAYYPSKYPLHYRPPHRAIGTSTANWPRPRTTTAWRSSPAWIPAAPMRPSTRPIPIGSLDADGNPYLPGELYTACSTVPITKSTSLRSWRKSSADTPRGDHRQ